ncbi:MAG: CRISPR-associated RAMP protein Csx10 [Coleofasciculus sp. A1-SPW-01]|uniref:type III-D CRISPR-associated RAMP protein Csx10 n=1 Tax=Coleofasciculus sp. A1-SPW-01 TaxID=3070819 RepID=UPI003305217F
MKHIRLEIKALSPLAIGSQKPGGSVSEVQNYIPGSVIRGAIATHILKLSGQLSTNLAENGGDFQALFLSDTSAIFHNAYPITPAIVNRVERVQVLPATAVSSKTEDGFKTQRGNGVFDTLIDHFCAEEYGQLYDPVCPTDGGRVEPFTGFYSHIANRYYREMVSKRLLTRVGINRRRATAEEQILYSLEVLNESQHKTRQPSLYLGAILVGDALANDLCQFINDHREEFRLGGSASRGLGKVEMKAKIVEIKSDIETRIELFNQQIKARWRDWGIFGQPHQELSQDRTYFTLDLQSDAILTEQWQRTMVVSRDMLAQFTSIVDSSLQFHVSYSSYDYCSGWNTAWGLMKDMALITQKGAVYLFSTMQKEVWLKALAELEETGVGERTAEGFGQVQICNPFHLIFQENPV